MNQFSSDKPQVFIPPAFEDFRGYLSVPYDRDVPFQVCQINQGYSREAFTLRGLHFQMGEHAQAKMVSCLHGSIFNVAVDLRPGKCFGYSYSEVLSFENRKMMYIPKGFAHGYLTLEDDTLMRGVWIRIFAGRQHRPCGMMTRISSGKAKHGQRENISFQKKIKMPCGWESCF